jgi:prephenate dehydratase
MKKEIIAFQGEKGAFSQQAARQFLGANVTVLPCERFELVYMALRDGAATGAAIPIENTLHGSVHENYDHLLNFDVTIVAETSVRIVHNLIAPPGTKFRDVTKAYSHPVALNQCLKFFSAYPNIRKETFYDTAGSVKMLMEQRPAGAAAIASSVAAETYGATILKRSIEDDRQNFTRFFLLRPQNFRAPRTALKEKSPFKTSIVFTTRNSPGSLFRALSALALRDISLTKIESRPMRGKPWEYLFYLDFLGHSSDEKVKNALIHLREVADFLRVLGSYPTARTA